MGMNNQVEVFTMQTLKEAKILTKLNGRLSKLLKFALICKCYDEANFPFVIATDS